MPQKIRNVLFLCTGNTARSILAEGILRKLGAGRFAVFSAGSQPKGVVNPLALATLKAHDYPYTDFRSKSWDEFAGPGAPEMHHILTVCDNAAGETCPIWPGRPVTAHWGIDDPAAAEGSEAERLQAFEQAFALLHARIAAFLDTATTNVRAAREHDVPAITAIYAEHVLKGTASFDTVPRTAEATRQRLLECQQRGWPFLVAENGGEVVGYSYATQFRDRAAYASTCENSIYVKADRRGQGIGAALLGELLARSEACGFRQMIAVVGGGEPASVALHESLGFTHAGRMKSVGRKFGRWLDTVYMQKSMGLGDTTGPETEPV